MTSVLVYECCSSLSIRRGRRLLAESYAPAAFVKFYEGLFSFLDNGLRARGCALYSSQELPWPSSPDLKALSKSWLVLHGFIATSVKCQFYSDRAALALEQVNDFESNRSSQ